MSKSNSTEQLNVIVRSPFELYFEGEAISISATNRVGNFDVLPGHADFFSMLEAGEVVVTPATGEPVKVDAKNGILTVRDNEAYLFINM
jgi:F0F1-type ATP synthase epsilon subunit